MFSVVSAVGLCVALHVVEIVVHVSVQRTTCFPITPSPIAGTKRNDP